MTAQSTWNLAQYDRFKTQRSAPFHDLLALVQPQPDMRVVDLGCGSGELTRELHQRLGAGETLGLDSSETMLARSAEFAVEGLRFEQGDIAEFTARGEYDLVFSNAALHWVEGQEQLMGRLTDALRNGGQVAVQVPANFDYPSHTVARELAREEPYREALAGYVREKPVLEPQEYATLLDRLGYREQHVRLQVYVHYLESRAEVVEWVKGSLLTDYQKRMPEALFEQFLAEYRTRLLPRLEDRRPFFYPFKRILFWGRK